jgi:hypothetical protein
MILLIAKKDQRGDMASGVSDVCIPRALVECAHVHRDSRHSRASSARLRVICTYIHQSQSYQVLREPMSFSVLFLFSPSPFGANLSAISFQCGLDLGVTYDLGGSASVLAVTA